MSSLVSDVIKSGILSLDETGLAQLLGEIKQRALKGEFDGQKQIPPDIIERLRQAGLYRSLVSKRFGGTESTPADFCRLIECIAEADGSTGWVASFGMSPVYLSALPLQTLSTLYNTDQGANLIFAGGIFPPQPATVVDGGMRFSGRWKYSSGCLGADIIGVGIEPMTEGKKDLPRIAVIPRSAVNIDRTWDTVGLTGTGSHDLMVDDAFVPEDWTFIRGGKSNLDEPLFRYPSLSFATQVLSVVAIGIARRAIDEVRGLSGHSASVTGAPPTSQRPSAKIDIAKAEASLQSLRAYFYDSIDTAWAYVLRGEPVPADKINMLRLSSTHAVREAANICRKMQMLMGMSGIVKNNAVARCVNDSLVITQHAFMGEMTYLNAGSMLCGQEPSPGYL